MTIAEIEEMIKKYVSTGIAVVVVLIAPGTRAGDPAVPSGSLPPGSQVITVGPNDSASTAATSGPVGGAGTDPGDRTGAAGTDPGGASTPDGSDPASGSGDQQPPDSAAGSGGSGADQHPGSDPSGSGGDQGDTTGDASASGAAQNPGTGDAGDGTSDGAGRGGNTGNGNSGGDNGNPGNDSGSDSTGHAGTSDHTADSSDTGKSSDTGNPGDAGNSGDAGSSGNPGSSGNSGKAGDSGSGGNSGSTGNSSGPGNTGKAAPGAGDSSPQPTSDGTTAAAKLGWGAPNREDDFSSGAGQWGVYDGAGHGGQGRRSPSAASTTGGMLTITGDSSGTTAGMAWNPGQKYGRWEGRVKAPASDPSYNALLLLWPDAENWPTGGEVDFMEMSDSSRQETNMFLHYGADNQQTHGKVQIDATQWHNWALEWTPDAITAYVDGQEWYRTTDKSTFPPGPMHLCIQLDWFPQGGSAKESTMQVDWVRQYPLDGSSSGSGNPSGSGTPSGPQGGSDQQGGGNDNAGNTGNNANDNGGDSPVRNVLRRMFSWG